MINNQSIFSLIEKRYSCRSYQRIPVPPELQSGLREMLASLVEGPLGSQSRFQLLAADVIGKSSIHGLTTYGFIKNPTGYIAGATTPQPYYLEDYGYLMEYAVLFATSLDLGTVWLGGTFNKGGFAKKMQLSKGEELPAVIATGLIADHPRFIDAVIRREIKARNRKSWSELFYRDSFDIPLQNDEAGSYARVLNMVQRAPSASNKQPWRIVKCENTWHFYVQRSSLYNPRNSLVGVSDMQRIDMGIAMCHFALSAQESGLDGYWHVLQPNITIPNALTEYTVSWVSEE